MSQLQAAWLRLPLGIRKFIYDAVESGIGAVIALNLVLPVAGVTIADAQRLAIAIVTAFAAGVVSALRRGVPPFTAWLHRAFPATLLGLLR